jgi:hypothetical protein
MEIVIGELASRGSVTAFEPYCDLPSHEEAGSA